MEITYLVQQRPPSQLDGVMAQRSQAWSGTCIGVTWINELPESFYADLCHQFHDKRERICSALDEAGLHPYVPQGSYYVLVEASRLPGDTSKDKALRLLEKTGVASVPGSAFYAAGGEALVRFCYAKPDNELDEACRRLQQLKAC